MSHTAASDHQAANVTVRSAVPTFLVPDVAETARWYVSQLGFELAGAVPERAPHVFASVQRGGAEIMLLGLADYVKPDLPRQRPGGRWDAYIRTDGVGALHTMLKGQPWIQTLLTQRSYGDWEFEVRDPNGYVLVFGGAR